MRAVFTIAFCAALAASAAAEECENPFFWGEATFEDFSRLRATTGLERALVLKGYQVEGPAWVARRLEPKAPREVNIYKLDDAGAGIHGDLVAVAVVDEVRNEILIVPIQRGPVVVIDQARDRELRSLYQSLILNRLPRPEKDQQWVEAALLYLYLAGRSETANPTRLHCSIRVSHIGRTVVLTELFSGTATVWTFEFAAGTQPELRRVKRVVKPVRKADSR